MLNNMHMAVYLLLKQYCSQPVAECIVWILMAFAPNVLAYMLGFLCAWTCLQKNTDGCLNTDEIASLNRKPFRMRDYGSLTPVHEI